MARKPSESSRQLKPEQAAAAHTLHCHVSVTAGPGAGKTLVLVERYLEILRKQKVSVDNVVAITFTNRAANEMRERVRDQIDYLLRNSQGEERRRWLRHKRALEGAVITTIHGFCSRLLHEFPVEANIDPQFVLLDEHQAAMLLETIVEQSLADAIHHGREKIVQLAQGAGRAALASTLAELYRRHRGQGFSLETIERLTAVNHASRKSYDVALNELDARMADLLSGGRLSKAAEEKRSRAAQEWPALRAILAQPPVENTIAAYCQAVEDFWEARPNKNSHPVIEQLDTLLWGNDSKPGERVGGKLPGIGFDLLAKNYSLALLNLLREIDRRLEAEKQRLSVLDFDDLQIRALELLERPEVLTRVSERYRFFLVDEFQDTNGLQRDLMTRLALVRGANLFIVGDRKQSVYGFRGADVDVFSEMTAAIENAGGSKQPLDLNFRSQQPLIDSFNFLFSKIFRARTEVPADALGQLGYVTHDPATAQRGTEHEPPLVELIVSVVGNDEESFADDLQHGALIAQERDADQVAARIQSLVSSGRTDQASANPNSRQDAGIPGFNYRDIAILLRAFTGLASYENALRRAGIPYLTVQGKGFYQREEISDLVQLLRFLDNVTDELALVAVLRSPLAGISDDAILGLRCSPQVDEDPEPARLHRRNLLWALRHHREIQFIDEAERPALDRASVFLETLIKKRNRYGIADLLRSAVATSEFMTVIAAHFDGAQRVANVEKLFRLAEQFEKSGHLIRDFVHYIEEFEAVGGREGEGQMDESANVVRLMTIHQAKGLEFPVVIIPDLHRESFSRDTAFMLDRHKGMTVRVPDGRGRTVRGALFNELQQRNRWREEFESMRLLYVAATRAQDRLILTGAIDDNQLENLTETDREQWLAWIWQALELDQHAQSSVINFGDDVQIRLTLDRDSSAPHQPSTTALRGVLAEAPLDASRPLEELFPLLQPIAADPGQSLRRFSVTQLINFQRCARQYYFDRLLRAPSAEERAVWNHAEAPEPPANLTATLKGAVIHRFCEMYSEGESIESRLRRSFEDVVAQRQSELAGRLFEINPDEAMRDLLPLAQNYLASEVFRRVSHASGFRMDNGQSLIRNPKSTPGLWSELRFRLRRPLGILTGTIDKLLITPAANGDGADIEIIDFKTNRFSSPATSKRVQRAGVAAHAATTIASYGIAKSAKQSAQGLLNFEAVSDDPAQNIATLSVEGQEPSLSIDEQVSVLAADYQLQMQAYALALRELLGIKTGSGSGRVRSSLTINSLRATLHFLDPNIESSLAASFLEQEVCSRAIDEAMTTIASLEGLLDAERFPPFPAIHCRICNFRDLCPAGRDWLRGNASV